MKLLLLASFIASFVALTAAQDGEDDWWRSCVVYQIYPRSFQDSDGDGIGDIQGIISRLDYLADIGVEAVWISPMYESPMVDFGYDISDFRNIDPIFGDLDDFDELVTEMHNRDLKLVMDFIPNHSSDQHDWFNSSVQRIDPYTNYYVWLDPAGYNETNGEPIPPNNWLSVFRYSAWEYSPERDQFYLHQFVVEQPDLNYRNDLVRQEMIDVLIYWLDLGVDGFRFDAVLHIFEDELFRDEPPSGDPSAADEYDYAYLDHIYTYDLPETKDVALAEQYEAIKDYSADRVDMLESYAQPEEFEELFAISDFPFNMMFIEDGEGHTYGENWPGADNVLSVINRVLEHVPEGKSPSWVLGNHDRWRVSSRFGASLVDAWNMLSLTLPGVSVTYQGEEIGMTNNMDITYEETQDPSGCNCGPDRYLEQDCSRDPERTPMQWSDAENAGFADAGVEIWLPVNSDYVTINVEAQNADPSSHLAIYSNMATRKKNEAVLRTGATYPVKKDSSAGDVLAVYRYDGNAVGDGYVTLINFSSDDTATISLTGDPQLLGQEWNTGIIAVNSDGQAGGLFDLEDTIDLKPYQAFHVYLTTL